MQDKYVALLNTDEEREESSRFLSRRAMLYIAGALTAAAALCTVAFCNWKSSSLDPAPHPDPAPLFRISATSSYDAGFQHGQLAQDRIQGWFAGPEMQSVFTFVKSDDGRKAFEQLKADNAAEFPEYVEEMRGIAAGAGATLDEVWCANMLNELESLMEIAKSQSNRSEHCSDVYAIADGGYAAGFAHGHNDDWSDAVKPFWYLMAITYNFENSNTTADQKLGFDKCAGVAYPAALIGWAPTWNGHGIFSTQNSMVPRRSRSGGLACAFVQRRAICGAHNLDEATEKLTVPGWSDSASMNIVDVTHKRMANVELWEDRHSVFEVTQEMHNYTHFNEFKHLQTKKGTRIDDAQLFVKDPRQGRADALPAPRSDADVMARLSDAKIFRPTATITTIVVNGSTGVLKVWCGVPSASHSPAYTWDILNFF
jgi:hypothetical protein